MKAIIYDTTALRSYTEERRRAVMDIAARKAHFVSFVVERLLPRVLERNDTSDFVRRRTS
jgi:hypothetical protein